MLVRDKIGERLKKEIEERGSKDIEIVSLESDDDFFEAIMDKLLSELDLLYLNKDISTLVEIIELIDWLKISLGTAKLNTLVEDKKDDLGLYWKRYYIKDKR